MNRKKVLGTLAGVFIGLAALTGAAQASSTSAYSATSLNVRSGPGTQYRAVDVLRPGERVLVDGCQYGWCYISHRGPDGWVSERYLRSNYVRRAPQPRVHAWHPPRHHRGWQHRPFPRHGHHYHHRGRDNSLTFEFSF